MNRSLLAALLLISAILPRGLAEPSQVYYTWDGSNLHEVHGDPRMVTPDHWEIWLYRANAAHTESARWGSISQKGLEGARKELEAGQVFERRYEKFFGTSYGSATHFNPSAPIAVLNSPIPALLDDYLQLNETYEKLSDMRESFRTAVDLSAPLAAGERGPLAEYLKSLKDGFDRAAGIYKSMSVLHAADLQSAPFSYTDRFGSKRHSLQLSPEFMELMKLDTVVLAAENKRASALAQSGGTNPEGIPAIDGSTGWMNPHRADLVFQGNLQRLTVSTTGFTISHMGFNGRFWNDNRESFDDVQVVTLDPAFTVVLGEMSDSPYLHYDNEKDALQFIAFLKLHVADLTFRRIDSHGNPAM